MSRRKYLACLLLLVPASCWAMSPVKLGVVCGDSMSPSMKNGQGYLLDETYYRSHPVHRGDVIVFRRDGLNYIKRVAAGPGDTLYVMRSNDADDVVMDWALPIIHRMQKDPRFQPTFRIIRRQVPPGSCYVLGDNLNCSVDSRSFGPVALENIRGKVLDAAPPTVQVEHIAGNYHSSGNS